ASVAGVFTRSSVVGAPVELCRSRVRRGRARGVVVNSGCSNVAMGARGIRDAEAMAAAAARAVGCDAREMLVASTGVIGMPLPLAKIRSGVRTAQAALAAGGMGAAARAIMTTDTVPKEAARTVRLGGRRATIAGIAKGAGMIEPNMATMLSFLATDAAVSPAALRVFLRRAADRSYNRLTIDGESSTSDTVLLFANGAAGNAEIRSARGPDAAAFGAALEAVCVDLVRALARDGEGATKLVTVHVRGARTPEQAERAAKRIANSMLVKTALFGGDPNWGRVLQTIGAGRIDLDLAKAEVKWAGVTVFRTGRATGPGARKRAGAAMAKPDIDVVVDLARGRSEATVWTCDLSYDYVKINAEYTT
ncbi:MAG TPA: bifunctional glutamate N-acetyltransferase/amino-acid acetyltransferase ArgJ, partial [Myxococcota bacterium]|nr:bifunctional glutamate N-acetyltransferase/amino-acid acetyltransferase ArgJ [Myxococcota bacterium]